MHDARAIANTVLDSADRYGFGVTNLKLQKLLYFAHGRYLVLYGVPLVQGEFEAWQHGPVLPLVYQQFRDLGASEITRRAMSLNPVTRQCSPISSITETNVVRIVDRLVLELGGVSASRLRTISHAPGGPWDITIKGAMQHANLGLRISNEVIRAHFGKQVVLMAEPQDASGDVDENTPYT